MKITIIKACFAFALTALSIGCGSRSQMPDEDTKKTFSISDTMMKRIVIDTAQIQQVQGELTLNGKIIADENKLVNVFPFVGGTVSEVRYELGDYVRKGEVLAVIKSGEVAEYERQLIDAQSDLLLAKKNLGVQRDLFSSRLTSERDVATAEKEVEKDEAELKRIQEVYRIYSINNSAQYVVKAPINGFIIEKNINRDMTLRSDKSDNIFTVADIDDVWTMANVYESDISKISIGLEAQIRTIAYPDSVIIGKVDKIFNILDPQTKTMSIRIKLSNSRYILKPGMAATVYLRYNEPRSMTAIPASSIIFDKGKTFVMVYRSRSDVETRKVTVAQTAAGHAYISSGLAEGERIITRGQLYIYDALND